MGEVYLAVDTKLDREVALKILPDDVAANTQRVRRFIQEAKAASALNHPHIITIHEVGEADSIHFIATEFIDGLTLRDALKNTPFPTKSSYIAIQVSGSHSGSPVNRAPIHAANIISGEMAT